MKSLASRKGIGRAAKIVGPVLMILSVPGYIDGAHIWANWLSGVSREPIAWSLLLGGLGITVLGNWTWLSSFFRSVPRAQPAEIEVTDVHEEPGRALASLSLAASTTHFGLRMAKAFPGVFGLAEYEGREAADRLSILLEEPLADETATPFWWFRNGMSCEIDQFERVSETACVFARIEAPLGRIVAFRDPDQKREFLYVEILGSEPTGLYSPSEPDSHVGRPPSEEYGVLGEYLITLSECMDGYTMIGGTPTSTTAAERRLRYLESYNFVIAGKSSPINSSEFDDRSQDIMDGMLRGSADVSDLRDLVLSLPKRVFGLGATLW